MTIRGDRLRDLEEEAAAAQAEEEQQEQRPPAFVLRAGGYPEPFWSGFPPRSEEAVDFNG